MQLPVNLHYSRFLLRVGFGIEFLSASVRKVTEMASLAKSTPKDAQVMMAILKDMGVTDYEPRVINQMLEFTYSKCVLKC